jgi:hypothetical protein
MTLALFVALATAAAFGAPALAHPGHDHKILGTVTMAATDHVMLKDKDGKDHTVYITADTKVTRAKKAMKVEDIKAGMRIVVTAATEDDKTMAKAIELGAAPATQ